MSAPSYLIEIFDEQEDHPIDSAQIQEVAVEVSKLEQQPFHEVHIHFVSKAKISALHDEYFNDPTPTDCISFPIDGPEEKNYRMMGEVFVCPKVAIEYAKANDTPIDREILLYVIHGLLHLMGYDDMNEEERAQMREAEARHLTRLNCY